MSETSVKIIKNEIRCRDDTVPKTVGTRSHCKVWLRACNNLPQPPPYILVFWGCGRLLHALNHTLQWLLVPTVFGTVSSLHLISFLMIFTLVDHTVHNVTVVNIPNCMVIVATRNPGLSHFQTQAYGGLNRLVSPDSV